MKHIDLPSPITERTLTSELDSIVGKIRKFILLKEFGSLKNLKKASYEDLIGVKGIGEKLTEKIIKFYTRH